MKLSDKLCVACQGGVDPLSGQRLLDLEKELGNGWGVIENHHLEKEFKFNDFKTALEFVNKVGSLAEEIGHHPDLVLKWGYAKVTIWTHKIDGLHESDFIFAAKVDTL